MKCFDNVTVDCVRGSGLVLLRCDRNAEVLFFRIQNKAGARRSWDHTRDGTKHYSVSEPLRHGWSRFSDTAIGVPGFISWVDKTSFNISRFLISTKMILCLLKTDYIKSSCVILKVMVRMISQFPYLNILLFCLIKSVYNKSFYVKIKSCFVA